MSDMYVFKGECISELLGNKIAFSILLGLTLIHLRLASDFVTKGAVVKRTDGIAQFMELVERKKP